MTVGLPGTGIGGLFYLVTALLMPVRELGLTLRGRSNGKRWRSVVLQVALAGGIIGGLWATAWGLTRLCPAAMHTTMQTARLHVVSTLGLTPALITGIILVGLLLGVELLRLCLWWPQSPHVPTHRHY